MKELKAICEREIKGVIIEALILIFITAGIAGGLWLFLNAIK